MVAVCACCADQQYMEESLFVIPWGDGPGTVGIVPQPGEGGARATGPCGLQVDRHGNLWLLDRRHLALTCFSPEGEPLRSVGKIDADVGERPWGEWNWLAMIQGGLRGYAVDGRGFVYLPADTGYQHMLVIDPAGEVVTSRADCYWRLIERRGEEEILWQLQHQTDVDWIGDLGYKRVATDDRDRLLVLGKAPEDESGRGHQWYAFSPDLDYLGPRPGTLCGPDGSTYHLERGGAPDQLRLHRWDGEGNALGTVQLTHPDGAWERHARAVFDTDGNVYVPAIVDREEPLWVDLPADVSDQALTMKRQYVVYKFGPDGRPLASATIPMTGLAVSSRDAPIDVDGREAIYYLSPAPDGMHVMRMRLDGNQEGEQ